MESFKNVDSAQTIDREIRCVEWFFGYGGNHLGLKRVIRNLRLVAACEIEGYAVANMVAKMEAGLLDAAPIWTDCKTFPVEIFRGLVDLFIASYPCQGFSAAGKRKGAQDPRFLWPWVIRAVATIQPRYCFFENVAGHVSLGLSTVISDLEEAGYQVAEGIFSAAECGAPQQRKRVFILAECRRLPDADSATFEFWEENKRRGEFAGASSELADTSGVRARESSHRANSESAFGQAREISCERSNGVGQADTNRKRSQGWERQELQECYDKLSAWPDGPFHWPGFVARPGEQQHEWEPPRVIEVKRGLGGGSNGRAANVDRLRTLGNGVYPATAAKAFVTLYRKLNK